MEDKLRVPTGNIGTGSTLLLVDEEIITAADPVRESAVINTIMASRIGIDISADKNCTVKLVRLPDGVTAGAVSDVGTVTAGTPAFFLYSSLLCPAVKIVVENTGGADMAAFAMRVRGAA